MSLLCNLSYISLLQSTSTQQARKVAACAQNVAVHVVIGRTDDPWQQQHSCHVPKLHHEAGLTRISTSPACSLTCWLLRTYLGCLHLPQPRSYQGLHHHAIAVNLLDGWLHRHTQDSCTSLQVRIML